MSQQTVKDAAAGMTNERFEFIVLWVLQHLEALKRNGLVDGDPFMTLTKTGLETVLDARAPSPTPDEINAAVSMFRHIEIEDQYAALVVAAEAAAGRLAYITGETSVHCNIDSNAIIIARLRAELARVKGEAP